MFVDGIGWAIPLFLAFCGLLGLAGIVLKFIVAKLTCYPTKGSKTVSVAALLLPGTSLFWILGIYFENYAVNASWHQSASGVTDGWYAPIGSDYQIEWNPVFVTAYDGDKITVTRIRDDAIFKPSMQSSRRMDELSATKAQLSGRYIFTFTERDTPEIPLLFRPFTILDTVTRQRTDFVNYSEFADAVAYRGVKLDLKPVVEIYRAARYSKFDWIWKPLYYVPLLAFMLLFARVIQLQRRTKGSHLV